MSTDSNLVVNENIYRNKDYIFYDDENAFKEMPIDITDDVVCELSF